jgi:hypothetical protein
MNVVCTNCKQTLATVDVLIPFSASVMCGECGATVGHQMVPAPVDDSLEGARQSVTQAEAMLASASERLAKLESAKGPAAASAGS